MDPPCPIQLSILLQTPRLEPIPSLHPKSKSTKQNTIHYFVLEKKILSFISFYLGESFIADERNDACVVRIRLDIGIVTVL